MRFGRLGSEGPEISVIGFGAWEAGGMAWGPNPPDEQTITAIRTGLEAGMNWIDTAEVYGGGRSEKLVKRALEGHDALVFTKVAPKPAGSGFHRAGIQAAARKSLERLGRTQLDLLQLHWPDRSTPVEETWEAMAGLVEEEVVKHIGVSNFDRSLIERCERIRHVDSIQPPFSMLHRQGRHDLFHFCADNGIGIICYGPLAYGLLTGAISRETKFGDDDWRGGGHGVGAYEELFAPGVIERNLDIVDQLRPISDRLDIRLSQLALAWVCHQEGVSGAIAGSRSPEHTSENAGAGDIVLESKDLDEIEAVITEAGRR
jgi:aryl-alcohol dehydrogenase-like predicted oxidoreductase